jgi:hypothetical protein
MRKDAAVVEASQLDDLVGRKIRVPGHFPQSVQPDDLRRKDGGVELRVITQAASWIARFYARTSSIRLKWSSRWPDGD